MNNSKEATPMGSHIPAMLNSREVQTSSGGTTDKSHLPVKCLPLIESLGKSREDFMSFWSHERLPCSMIEGKQT